jgi:formate--tetrahydrofolate ligase
MRALADTAAAAGLAAADLLPYGHDVAKVALGALARPRAAGRPTPRLVLVTAINPTAAGEGKTTTSIGLVQGLAHVGRRAAAALREPSLGPCMGVKGGATGGGMARVEPSDRINLHFTGDFHAVASAHNLLAALVDNALHFGADGAPDPRRVSWKRVVDMNDRALRQLVLGLGGVAQGVPRESGFDITAASEVMAMLCLAEDAADLRARLARTLVGARADGAPVAAADVGGVGAMLALLRDALMPNLVQTPDGVPVFVHGGPFANIAHGCNSVLATRMALHHADYAVTEAGFGSELGAEKFFHIKCRSAGLDPAAVVVVATVRALKLHGRARKEALAQNDPAAVHAGLPNLEAHLANVAAFGKPAVVALNRFAGDDEAEIAVVREACARAGARFAVAEHFVRGGAGAAALAEEVIAACEEGAARPFTPLYALADAPEEKIRTVARRLYGAADVEFDGRARRDLERAATLGCDRLPVCIAKPPSTLSGRPLDLGRPRGFTLTVREVEIARGAGFLVALTGDLFRMPGLPRRPQALAMDLGADGSIVGLG